MAKRARTAERFCRYRDRFDTRCNELLNHDEVHELCWLHWPVPRDMVAKDVGPPLEQRVYFVFAADVEIVKIGTTKDLTKRVRALNHASPSPLILLGSIEGGLQVERWFHQRCIASRSHLEWFHWTPKVCAVVDEALKRGDGAARFMCPAEYQTDRNGLDLAHTSPLPNVGPNPSHENFKRWREGKDCCGHTCSLHHREAK